MDMTYRTQVLIMKLASGFGTLAIAYLRGRGTL